MGLGSGVSKGDFQGVLRVEEFRVHESKVLIGVRTEGPWCGVPHRRGKGWYLVRPGVS